VPWEIGLAETQQTLLLNDLRSRITVQTDGQLKTGRDVVIAALLGADEMGFSTAPLIATGCIMMRACHLNTCPVGIATQDPELRKRFKGTPEHVVNFFFYVAEEARQIMAELGIAKFEDLIGRVDLLEADDAVDHWKARGIDLSNLLHRPDVPEDTPLRRVHGQESPLPGALDWDLIGLAQPAIERAEPVRAELPVRNVNRAVGGLLSHAVTVARGAEGLPEGTIQFTMHGSAGQSFGAWLAPGIELTLHGDANDYTGKGLSGGTVAIRPPEGSTFKAEENVIVGNTVLYGATKGKAFFRGLAGERFAVRNSGADAVIEGVGDHGCEYMTGGHVVVLGKTGRNFAAGMSGGIAYVLDEDRGFAGRCNQELVDLEELDVGDAALVRALVEEHAERTGSPVAERVLASFDELLPLFRKVMPRDYRAALEALAAGNGSISYPDELAVSSGGEGFVTAEVESGSAG
jgi:glutamate synthase domain-containing protein 3